MQITEKHIIISNRDIYTRIASPVGVSPSCVVVLVHGIGDHSGRYLEWFNNFEQFGIAWLTADLPGHGKSDGLRGFFNSLQSPFAVIEQLLIMAEIRFPNLPIILYGHSMGGNIALNFVLRRHPKIQGLILTSPWLGLVNEPPKWKLQLAKIAAVFHRKMMLKTGITREQLTYDNHALEKYQKDTLIHGKITLGTFLMMYEAMHYARNNADHLRVPTLLLHGTNDSITDWQATKKLALKIGRKSKFIPFEGMLHELHHDPNNNLVANEIKAWTKTVVIEQHDI
jgi:alpha-beta hydrolase superfamily lysophospholipase